MYMYIYIYIRFRKDIEIFVRKNVFLIFISSTHISNFCGFQLKLYITSFYFLRIIDFANE